MRARWLGVLIAIGIAPAAGAPRALATAGTRRARGDRAAVGFMPVGAIDYIWQGDPARGCAAAGLCGVVGSLQVVTGDSSEFSSPGLPPIEIEDDDAVTRVDRPTADGTQQPCVDPVPYDVQFVLRHGPGGKLRAVPQAGGAQPPSAGQCAGPTAGDLLSVALPARKLARRGYDLSGSVSFGAGPFAVTVVSTIRALFVSSQSLISLAPPPVSSGPRPPKTRQALAEQADVTYRITRAQGSLMASFSGLGPPFCAPLDACGTTGGLSLALSPPSQTLEFSGSRLVKRRVGSRHALADLRDGRLSLNANPVGLSLAGALTGTSAGASATPCRDETSDPAIGLNGVATRAAVRLILDQPESQAFFSGQDELRTRCPGPGSSEILGSRPLATGAVAVHDLGARRLTVVLSATGQFHGTAYAGSRSGSIVLTLVRSHVSGGTRRVRVIGGQVIG